MKINNNIINIVLHCAQCAIIVDPFPNISACGMHVHTCIIHIIIIPLNCIIITKSPLGIIIIYKPPIMLYLGPCSPCLDPVRH